MLAIGTVVKTADGKAGWVRTEPTLTASGSVVSLEFLPKFADTTPTGWADYRDSDLIPYNLCACVGLGFRKDGEIIHTGCDTTRTPGKGRKFLPGHDAKAKSLLIKAWGHPMFGGWEHSLDAAREFGFSLQVAAGIDKARAKFMKNPLGDSVATRAVMRNLQKSEDNSAHTPIGYSFINQDVSLEDFTEAAKRWLRDKSELSTRTIEGADYQVAYDYFS